MTADLTIAPVGKPLWRRVAEFPLVTMVLALAVLALALGLVGAAMMQMPTENLSEDGSAILTGLGLPPTNWSFATWARTPVTICRSMRAFTMFGAARWARRY
jgi:hypothetical protein